MYDVKPDKASDKAGAAALKDEQDDIDAKKQEVADAEKKLADFQAKLDCRESSDFQSQNDNPPPPPNSK